MKQMERFRGHFYNWYDTRDLRPLDPKYVSAVDSGNMAGHLLALANGCRDLIEKSSFEPRALAGVEDSVHLMLEALGRVTETRRTHIVTRKQLSNAAEALLGVVGREPADAIEWALRFVEMRERARTVADIAQTLAQELGEPGDSSVRAWAEAAQASVESNYRDATILIPWLRLEPQRVVAMAERRPEEVPEWAAIEPFFHSIPSLGEAPERFEAAIRALNALGAELVRDRVGNKEKLARIDALVQALERSVVDAVALDRRLAAIVQTCGTFFQEMDFSFLFDPSRKLFAIGYRAADGSLDSNC
jgi:cyclic beta-1,2-glucan synthetase